MTTCIRAQQPTYLRFKDISVSERILNTVFLITVGVGYLAGLANLYYTHQGLDGKPGLSVDDVVLDVIEIAGFSAPGV